MAYDSTKKPVDGEVEDSEDGAVEPDVRQSSPEDQALIKEIRERYDYARQAWEDIRDEARKDMMCVNGDIWQAMDPDGFKEREANMRPMLHHDELNQYFNICINDVRANPMAIKFAPVGNGANDQTAQFYADKTREIEYRSKAQIAYTTAFENTVQRSYGWCRVLSKYAGLRSNNQDIWIESVEDPDTIYADPDARKPDSSDMQWLFVHETMTYGEHGRRWPGARIKSFDARESVGASAWMGAKKVTVAEYWKIKQVKKNLNLYLLPTGEQKEGFPGDFPGARVVKVLRRGVEVPSVCQYITNGFEILDEKDWLGASIPFVSCYGKVLYLDKGHGTERSIHSMTRLARYPQLAYDYITTASHEAIGGVPRATFIGFKGQFEGHETRWQEANHKPVAYLEANARTQETGQETLPLPQRQSWDPPIQNMEIAKEAARRAIQSAMATNFMPTQAQRRNEKSGVALKEIDNQQQRGTYHFVDHYKIMIERVGVLIEDLIDKVYDTPRDVPIRKADDKAEMVRVNDPEGAKGLIPTKGDHVVTVSTGPSYDSEREAQSDFADTIVQNLQMIATVSGPKAAAAVMAKAIKLKNLGPIADQIVEIIEPAEYKQGADGKPAIPPELQAAMKQLQDENGQLKQAVALDQAKQQATIEKAKIDAGASVEKAKVDGAASIELQHVKNAATIRVAEINAAVKGYTTEVTHAAEHEQLALGQAHEAEQNEQDRQHEAAMSIVSADQAHQQGLEAGDVAHGQGLEAADVGHQQALEQAANQAALQPPAAEAGA